MNGERKLKEEGFTFKMMPTPTSITHSCGICIRSEVKENIDDIIEKSIIDYKNIYEKKDGEFIKII